MTSEFSLLPRDIKLTYLAEGGANIVFKISPATRPLDAGDGSGDDGYGPDTPPPTAIEPWETDDMHTESSEYWGKVIRLRKDLDTASSVLQAQRDFEEVIAPLFPKEHLIEQTVVRIVADVLSELNASLRQMEERGKREALRVGTYLRVAEGLGTVMDDMKTDGSEGRGSVVHLEIKPKWLAQSPSAPQGARNCRTCALRLMRKAAESDRSGLDEQICPLDFVSSDEHTVARLVEKLRYSDLETSEADEDARRKRKETDRRLADFFLKTPLLRKLRAMQRELDPLGVLSSNSDKDGRLRTAMTLRDCSLYLKVPLIAGEEVEAWLGDLDLKSSSKWKHWRSIEQQLRDGGWYMLKCEPPDMLCSLQRASVDIYT